MEFLCAELFYLTKSGISDKCFETVDEWNLEVSVCPFVGRMFGSWFREYKGFYGILKSRNFTNTFFPFSVKYAIYKILSTISKAL